MENKYKLTGESIIVNDKKLYRIEALKDFKNVKKHDKGGFVESDRNLSQDGDCWIYGDAMVFDNARVYGSAIIWGTAQVCDNAVIFDSAQIYDDAVVHGDASVYLSLIHI